MTNYSFYPKMSVVQAASFLGITTQTIYSYLKNKIQKEQSHKSTDKRAHITHDIAKNLFKIKFKHTVIANYMRKGGVGKTTSLHHIGWCANCYGAKILLIDLDSQRNLTIANRIDPTNRPVLIDLLQGQIKIQDAIINIAPGLDIIPSRTENGVLDNFFMLKKIPLHTFFADLLEPIKNNYDFIMIDCPPSLGLVVTSAVLCADLVLIPLLPDSFSEIGLNDLTKEMQTLNGLYKKTIKFKIFLNQFDSRTILSERKKLKLFSDKTLEKNILRVSVRQAQEITNLISKGENLFSVLKKSPAKEEYNQLTQALLSICPSK